jgi:signal peptidase I
MNDNHDNPYGHDTRFAPPEPERFDAPDAPREPREEEPRPVYREHVAPAEPASHPPSPHHGFAEAPAEPLAQPEQLSLPSHPLSSPHRGFGDAGTVHGYAPMEHASLEPRAIEADLLPVDPLLPSEPGAAALAAQERLALDTTSLWLNRLGEELVAWLKTLASAAVYATLIVTFGFQVARVEGMSMAPTLQDQDRLIVNKLAYRIGDPKVGDIVMLYYPLKPEKSFVKRIIAEEGDQVRIVDGRVFRNDVPLDDSFVPQEYRSHDDWGPQVIPEGYYFVMGDHRNNSSDSRHWGFVPKKYIIGKVQLRWWPMGHAQVF